MTPRMVLLTWLDAHSPEASTVYALDELDTIAKPLPIITSGWLLRDDETGVIIGGEFCGDQHYRAVTVVPRGMVQSISDIATRKPRAKKPKETPA